MTDKQAIKFLVDHGLLNKSATWADITPVVRKHPSLQRMIKTVQLAYKRGIDDARYLRGELPTPEASRQSVSSNDDDGNLKEEPLPVVEKVEKVHGQEG